MLMENLLNNPDLYGWIGNTLLAICSIPQAFKAYKEGNSNGISWLFIITWFFGECLAFYYHAATSDRIPQFLNYIVNIAGTSVILYYKLFARKDSGNR